MAFGIAGDADAEVVAAADVGDEGIGVGEAALGGDEGALPGGRVATKGKHVSNPAFPQVVEDRPDLLGGVADAGEMRHRSDLQLILNS